MTAKDLTTTHPADLAPTGDILSFIERAARDPSVDVDKLERLLAMKERLDAQERERAFFDSLARLQASLPQITKNGHILDKSGNVRNKYARLEDIDDAIRPLCSEEGFAFTFDQKRTQYGCEYSCKMSHRAGHSETRTLTLPLDGGGGMNAVQAVGSTTSYARRYLLEMHLHLVKRDEDDDGNGGPAFVTAEQAEELRTKLAEKNGDTARFLKWAGAETFEGIASTRYQGALHMIAQKVAK